VNTTVLFVGVVVFAFVAGRVLERFTAKAFALAGVEYLILGVVLGPVLGVLGRDVMQALDLFVSTVLGVLGFLVGLEIRQIRATTESLLAGLGAAAAVVLGLAAAVTGLYQGLGPEPAYETTPILSATLGTSGNGEWLLWITPEALWIGLTVGAAAGTCSTVMVDAALRRFGVSPERAAVLRTMTAAAQVLAVFAFGLAMAGSRATTTTGAMSLTIVEWTAIGIVSGAFTGLLFSIFLGHEDDTMRLSVATVGVIVLAAGVGAALGVTPLFANLFAGLTLALTSTHAARLEDALRPLRFPTTVLVLLLAGATWVPVEGWYWVLVPSYVLLRSLARLVFSRAAVSTFMGDHAMAQGIGRALLGQGVLASAISLAFAQRFPELAAPVTSTILGGVLLNDLFAQRSLRRYLADAGEIKAVVPVAVPERSEEADPQAAAVPVHVEDGAPATTGPMLGEDQAVPLEVAAVPVPLAEALTVQLEAAVPVQLEAAVPVPLAEALTVQLEAAVPVSLPDALTVPLDVAAVPVSLPEALTVRLEAATPVPLADTLARRLEAVTPVPLPNARLEAITPVPLPNARPGTATPVPLPDALTAPLDVAAVPVAIPEAPTVPLEGAVASDAPPEPGSPAEPAAKERA